MSSNTSIYDNAFGAVLQSEGDIKKFLDALFSFLYRRTDFYLTMKTPDDKMGFPPGVAEKLVYSAYKKYAVMADERVNRTKAKEESHVKESLGTVVDHTNVVDHTEEISTSPLSSAGNPLSTESVEVESVNIINQDSEKNTDTEVTSSREKCEVAGNILPAGKSAESLAATDCPAEVTVQQGSSDECGEVDESDPQLIALQKKFQSNPDSYNGAIRDNYSWSQSITDVDVSVKVPANIRRSADVSVVISKKHLKVACRLSPHGEFVDIVDGNLTWDIKKDESMWNLSPGEHVLIFGRYSVYFFSLNFAKQSSELQHAGIRHIEFVVSYHCDEAGIEARHAIATSVNLEKVQERWWDAVFVNEPKISVRKIDPSRPITDLDDESQAKIEELMYNEQQKRLGLPQSHEKKVHDMLKQAWDAEGSPFKGQPFDPSIVNVTQGPC